MLRCAIRYLSFSIILVLLWGCSHSPAHPQDPYENFNRGVFTFNKNLDKYAIKPVAYVYFKYLPQPLQLGIGNFYDNLREISNVANDLLQGQFSLASRDASRFLINSTLGIGGFFDPCTSLGLEHRREDFGQTLYHWGYKNSSYLILPILGPSTVRDGIGIGVDYFALSVWPWIDSDLRYALLALDMIDYRARLLRHETVLDTLAVDEYAFLRDAYFQRRQYLFNNEEMNTEVNPYSNDDETKGSKKSKSKKSKKA